MHSESDFHCVLPRQKLVTILQEHVLTGVWVLKQCLFFGGFLGIDLFVKLLTKKNAFFLIESPCM